MVLVIDLVAAIVVIPAQQWGDSGLEHTRLTVMGIAHTVSVVIILELSWKTANILLFLGRRLTKLILQMAQSLDDFESVGNTFRSPLVLSRERVKVAKSSYMSSTNLVNQAYFILRIMIESSGYGYHQNGIGTCIFDNHSHSVANP